MRLKKIISGGQTGADEAGLEAARMNGLETGGTAPKHYRTEVGPNPQLKDMYGLTESSHFDYVHRTKDNVNDADATLILAFDPKSAGTRLTIRLAKELSKPYVVINPFDDGALTRIHLFLRRYDPEVLNVAGNRSSVRPGFYRQCISVLHRALCETLYSHG